MKKETPGKVIITPRPPAGSQEGDGAEILLKCERPRFEDLKPIDPADAKKQEPVSKDEKLPKVKAPNLKDKAKVCCPKPALKKK
jgi:hypothetical protein